MRVSIIILFLGFVGFVNAQEKVGVNTEEPQFTLDVNSGSESSGGDLQLATKDFKHFLRLFSGRPGDSKPYLLFSEDDTFRIAKSSPSFADFHELITILPNGNIGFGVTNPSHNLTLSGGLRLGGFDGIGNRNIAVGPDGAVVIDSTLGGADTDWSETPLAVIASKNVGVGAASASADLFIKGTESDGVNTSLEISVDDGTPLADHTMHVDGDEIDVYGTTINDLKIQQNSAGGISMVLGGGNVGVGQTPPNTRKMTVTGTAIPDEGNPSSLPATFSILNSEEASFNEMVFDGNNIMTVDRAMHLNRQVMHNVVTNMGGGNFGVGISAPKHKIDIVGNNGEAIIHMNKPGLGIDPYADGARIGIMADNNLHVWNSENENIVFGTNDIARMQVFSDGRVGIGTNTPATGFLLSIDGKAMAEEVRVQLSTAWPDYVFEEGYHLRDLEALETEINALGHLPGVPAADELESKGLDLGEIQRLQMEKIEELTLYILQLHERIEQLENAKNADDEK